MNPQDEQETRKTMRAGNPVGNYTHGPWNKAQAVVVNDIEKLMVIAERIGSGRARGGCRL